MRRVCLAHVEDWGLWEDLRKHARQETSDPRALATLDISPHWSAYSGASHRKSERMRQEARAGRFESHEVGSASHSDQTHHMSPLPHEEMEDTIMHQMVEDLLLREAQDVCEDECACEAPAAHTEDSLLTSACTPLFDGSTYSILRASLEILNL